VNPKIIECSKGEVDYIVNSILQEQVCSQYIFVTGVIMSSQNMTLEDFKSELDSKLEKVLTMKYYLTKLYKPNGGHGSRAERVDNVDNSSTSSVATTNSASSGSSNNTSSFPGLIVPSSNSVCGLVTAENPDTTFSWKCCCCSFASTGKNLKSTRESYRKHHKNWHSPEGLAQQAANGMLPPVGSPGGDGPVPKKRKASLGSVPRKSKVLNQMNGPVHNSMNLSMVPGFSGLNNPNINVYPNIDDLIVANASSLNMNMTLSDVDAAILVDVSVTEDDFSSLFDD
jgi:hypothetical protein